MMCVMFCALYTDFCFQWVDARDKFCKAADILDPDHRMSKSMWGQFWASHQRFFKYLCISAKVKCCVQLAREAIQNGKVCGVVMCTDRFQQFAVYIMIYVV